MVLDHFRELIALAIARLCKEVTKSRSRITVWDWLYVLPLYNFMKGYSEPFMRPESASTLTPITARAKELEFKDLKNKIPVGYVEYIIDSCSYVIICMHTPFSPTTVGLWITIHLWSHSFLLILCCSMISFTSAEKETTHNCF